MEALKNNLYKWFIASLPLHILTISLFLFGNNLVYADIGLIVSLYTGFLFIGTLSFPVASSGKYVNLFHFLFALIILINLFASIVIGFAFFNEYKLLQSITESIERLRITFMYLMGLTAIPVILQSLNKNDNSENIVQKKNTSNKIGLDILLLILMVGIAFYVRYYNIDHLPSYRDEDHHIQAVLQLLSEQCHDYKRGLLVTYSGALLVKLTDAIGYDAYLHCGRLASTIIGSLVCIPIYFLGMKISRLTGIFAVLLWVFSPWAVGISQNFREHIYYVFLISLMSLLLMNILEWVLNYKKELLYKIILSGTVIGLIFSYAVFIDWFSTLKISGVILSVLTFSFLIVHFTVNIDQFKLLKKYSPFLIILAILFFIPITQIKFFSLVETPDMRWANTYLYPASNTPIHWWTNANSDLYLVYFLIILTTCVAALKRHKYFWIFTITFNILLVGYTFFFDRYYAPRYIVFIYPFFIISIAYAFSGLVWLFSKFFFNLQKRNNLLQIFNALVVIFLIIILVKPFNIYGSIKKPKKLPNGGNANTGIVHYDKHLAINFMRSLKPEKRSEATILTTIYGESLRHEIDDLGWVEKFNYKDPNRMANARNIMNSTKHGYLIIDRLRNREWGKNFMLKEGKSIKIGNSNLKKLTNTDIFIKANSYLKRNKLPSFKFNENHQCEIFEWTTNVLSSKAGIDNSKLSDTDLIVDTGSPFTISFLLRTTNEINDFPISIGDADDNNIIFYPSVDNKQIMINYGSNFEEDLLTFPVEMNDWTKIDFYQYGGSKGSYFGVILNGKDKYQTKIPVHKNDSLYIYTNKTFIGDVMGIEVMEGIDKSKINSAKTVQ